MGKDHLFPGGRFPLQDDRDPFRGLRAGGITVEEAPSILSHKEGAVDSNSKGSFASSAGVRHS